MDIDLTQNIVAQYKMNDASGTLVENSVDINSPATYTGGADIADRTTDGRISGALELTASGDIIDTGQTFTSTLQKDFSINFWVRFPDVTPTSIQYIIQNDDPASQQYPVSISISLLSDSDIRFIYKASEGTSLSAKGPSGFINDTWHMVTATLKDLGTDSPLDDVRLELYVDGAFLDSLDSSTTLSTWISENNMEIAPNAEIFDIDNFCIFDKVINQEEINFLYNDGEGTEALVVDTDVSDELVLETPTILITGTYYNAKTGLTEEYSNTPLQNDTLQSGSNFTSQTKKTFIGDVTVSFTSRYPLKTYPKITRAKNQFIGRPPFGYQQDKAEIRYNLAGRGELASIYKEPLILKHNTAGSDNILLNYKIFYKGKASKTGQIDISIDKTEDKFYSFDENG